MGRTSVKVITQRTDAACGPVSLKHALEIVGQKKSVTTLEHLCKTNRNGTSTANMINALRKLGYAVLAVEHASLRHLTSALHYTPQKPRAVIVSYLYDENEKAVPERDSGHWATVSSFSARNGRIVVFDSLSGKKKSYIWKLFRTIWKDYDRIRRPISKFTKKIKLVRKWKHKLMLIVAKNQQDLPKFRIPTARVFAD